MADQVAFNQSLQDRITSLKKKQRELELIAQVVDFANALPAKETDFKDVAQRVADLFISFSNRAMDNLNGPVERKAPAAVQAVPSPVKEESVQNVAPSNEGTQISVGDKLLFLQSWKHLEKAKVKVGDKYGVVRGLDAPHVIVVLDDNTNVKIIPANLDIIQKGRN